MSNTSDFKNHGKACCSLTTDTALYVTTVICEAMLMMPSYTTLMVRMAVIVTLGETISYSVDSAPGLQRHETACGRCMVEATLSGAVASL